MKFDIDLPQLNSVVLILVAAALSFMATRYFTEKKIKADLLLARNAERAEMASRITDLEAQLGMVKQAVIPISAAFQAILIKELTHPHFHTQEMDELMEGIGPPCTLTEPQTARLAFLLNERATEHDGSIPEMEREAAMMLPFVMKRVAAEGDATAEMMKIVGVPKEDGEEFDKALPSEPTKP